MSQIRKLNLAVINKISAGEVIENPSSVVKELLENSLDAGSNNISIEIKQAGISNITITDNGIGIPSDQLELAFERYSTSKLYEFEDLLKISSLGFRGEALASIAAVANVTLQSKPKNQTTGWKITIKTGEKKALEAVASQTGTKISVNNLFVNMPVRLKFLKSLNSELRRITQVVTAYCLAYPEIGFSYVSDKEKKINFPPKQCLAERIKKLFGTEIANQIIPIDLKKTFELPDNQKITLSLTGFIGKPQIAKTTRQMQFFFINKRPVSDYLCSYKIKEAYGTLLEKKYHPAYFLSLKIPPFLIDANVHPRKNEVKFQSSLPVYQFIEENLKMTLQKSDNTATIYKEQLAPKTELTRPSALFLLNSNKNQVYQQKSNELAPQNSSKQPAPEVIAQILDTYILARNSEGIMLIDQHAAQERILYEAFLVSAEQSKKQIQELLVPEIIELSLNEKNVLEEHKALFTKLGFNIEPFGKQQIAIRAVPVFLIKQNIGKVVKAFLEQLLVDRNKNFNQLQLEQIIKEACKNSLKANEPLSIDEMQMLISQLFRCSQKFTCPHGRPTIIHLDQKTLEKIFHRR